jgi:hypothetical protein
MTSLPDHSLPDEPMVDEPLPDEYGPAANVTPEPLPGEPLPADHIQGESVQAEHMPANHWPVEPLPAEPMPARFGDAAALDDSTAPDGVTDIDETYVDETTGVGMRTAAASVAPGRLTQQWHDIQAMFVDDPQGSVQRAAQAADAAVTALSETLRQRQTALAPAGTSNDQRSTEQLRQALREYRVFCERVAGLADQLPHAGAMA